MPKAFAVPRPDEDVGLELMPMGTLSKVQALMVVCAWAVTQSVAARPNNPNIFFMVILFFIPELPRLVLVLRGLSASD
jgi:hypothetical protein